MIIFVAFVAFAATAARLHRGKGVLAKSGAYLFGFYAVSFLCACVVALVEGQQASTVPTLYFLAVILCFTAPLISTKGASMANCPPPEWHPFLTPLSWMVSCIGSYATATVLPSAVRMLLGGGIGETRNSVYVGDIAAYSGVTLLSQLASGVWPVCLVLLVLAVLSRRPAVLLVALALGSISGTVVILACAGRSGFVYLGLLAGLLTALTWPTIIRHRPNLRRRLLVGAAVCGVFTSLAAFSFAKIRGIGSDGALASVSNDTTVNAVYSIVLYGGSAVLNFQDFWYIQDEFGTNLMGQRSFPVFYGVLERLGFVDDYSALDIMTIYKPIYDANNLEHAVFCGFQRELVADFGKLGTMVGSVAWAALGWLARRRYEKRIDPFSIFTMAFFGSVPLLGIFFLSYGELAGNVSLSAMLACIGLMWMSNGMACTTHLGRPATSAAPAIHDGGGR